MSHFAGFRCRKPLSLALTVVLSLSFALAFSLQASANEALIRLSTDPFTNTTSQHQTEVEPDTYAFGNTIVAAFQVGRFVTGGSSDIGWATSTDGGATWKHDFLSGLTVYKGGTFSRASDPAVAYDAKHHTWMISSLVFDTVAPFDNGIAVNLSSDGLHWGQAVLVAESTTLGFDKNWTTCDGTATSPFYGHCYTEWDTFVNNTEFNLISMSTSTDGGLTWGAAKHTANKDNGIGGQPVVQPNGKVIVPIIGETATTADIAAFTSTDGGASWSGTVQVATLNQYIEKAHIRNGGLPSAEIDGAGKVYVVWQDCRFEPNCSANDIVMSTSTDGVNWSVVTRIPLNPIGSNVDDFTPGIGVNKHTSGNDAQLALTYYYFSDASCSTSTCQLFIGFISSTNGGHSWSEKEQIAGPMNLKWLPNAFGRFAGDYISTSFVGSDDDTLAALAVAKPPPAQGQFDVAMYTTPEDALVVTGGNITSTGDQAVATAPVAVSTLHTMR